MGGGGGLRGEAADRAEWRPTAERRGLSRGNAAGHKEGWRARAGVVPGLGAKRGGRASRTPPPTDRRVDMARWEREGDVGGQIGVGAGAVRWRKWRPELSMPGKNWRQEVRGPPCFGRACVDGRQVSPSSRWGSRHRKLEKHLNVGTFRYVHVCLAWSRGLGKRRVRFQRALRIPSTAFIAANRRPQTPARDPVAGALQYVSDSCPHLDASELYKS